MTELVDLTSDRARVLVVVGTDHHPFDRLMRWVDGCARSSPQTDVGWLVQAGTSVPPAAAETHAYLSRAELEDAMAGAAAVVCHGGPGSIMDARTAGHLPIVVPRVRALGEHVDDHQVRFARRLAETGQIRLAEDEERFRACVLDALSAPQRRGEATGSRNRSCERFMALADRLLEEPPRGLLALLARKRSRRAA